MGHQQKTLKLEKNNDVITQLPDEIISQFISLLPLKEAVRTSIVSKSWMWIWTTHMDVVCNATTILGCLSDKSRLVDFCRRQDQRGKFIERVDHIMQQRCKGLKMNSIVIRFPLSQEHESHINNWIISAVLMGVEKINLNLTSISGLVISDASSCVPRGYTFPLLVLTAPGKACTVKHLRLVSCSLNTLFISNSLTSLVTIELQRVRFTDQQLDVMLCNCLFLEKMVVKSCPDLVNFKLTSRSSRLKFLAIKSCCRLDNVELYAENLEILEYTGPIECTFFKHVPKLAEVYFCFYETSRVEGATNALSRIANEIPQLEILNMVLVRFSLLQGVPPFINLKHLLLTVFPLHDEDKLSWVTYILKAAPLLNNLQLNQFVSSFTRQSEVNDRQLPEFTHMNLREIEINGYQGNQHDNELLKYLVDSAVMLDLLVISPQMKRYTGLNDMCHEDSDFFGKKLPKKLSMEKIEELHSIVPKAVRVKFL